jgi:hypothetical protein
MRYLTEAEESELMGTGYPGELQLGADGHLYQWTEEIDGLGNLIGSWKRLRKLGRRVRKGMQRVVRRALPIAQRVASAIPLPQAQAVAAGIRRARPLLQRAGIAGHDSLGALYQAPDGTVYQVEGLGQDEEFLGLGDDELMEVAGIGHLGEVRLGADGHLYQWTEEMDGLGNLIGSWKRLRKLGRRIRKGVRRAVRQALPIAQQVASSIPHPKAQAVATGIKKASPLLRRAGFAGPNDLGALYQAPDGTFYQVGGIGDLAEDEELYGLGQDEELYGPAENDELYGLAEDEEFDGMGNDEALYGLAEDEELYGLAEDEELEGLEGYLREDGVNGLEAYVKEEPPATRMFVKSSQSPEIWRPLW